MSRPSTLLVALLSLTALLAGCHAPEGGADDGNGSGDGNGDGMGGDASTVSAVRITRAPPAQLAPGENVTICWDVDGEGNIPHTAVHWDNESHDGDADVTFQDYDLGMRFPDNATSGKSEGYNVPGEFCTSFEMPDEPVYVIAHAFGADDEPSGQISEEHAILTL